MKKFSLILLLVIAIVTLGFKIYQNPMMGKLVDNLEFMVANYPQTKIYIHTDKPYYTKGDDLWFSVYAMNANDHSEDPVSGLVYVHLENESGEVVAERNIQLNGKIGNGDFEINEDWEEGVYTLRGFSAYMQNYDHDYTFSKEIAIWSTSTVLDEETSEDSTKSIQVRFFPEGGHLVNGLTSKVAFEVSDGSKGDLVIKDNSGNVVTSAKAMHNGIGYFSMIPEYGKTYSGEYKGVQFNLPSVRSKGYSFTVNNLSKESLFIEIDKTSEINLEGCFVIGHMRGLVFLQQDGITNDNTTIKIDKSSLPDGVAQFTLFNENGSPVAERAVFMSHEKNEIDVEASVPYEYLNTRQKTTVDLTIGSDSDVAIDADLSIAVVDASLMKDLDKGANIKSYLLLNSEFTKGISNPNFYFKDNSKKTKFLLDLLMMTRGWTRIKWEDVVSRTEPEIEYIPESGFTISGTVFYKGNPIQASVEFSIINAGFVGDVIETQADGSFRASFPELREGSNIFLKASIPNSIDPTSSNTTDDVRLFLNSTGSKKVKSMHKISYEGPGKRGVTEYIERSKKIETVDSIYSAEWQIELDEVSISASDLSRDIALKKEYGIGYRHYDSRIMIDSIMKGRYIRNIFELVRDQVSGVQIVGTPDVDQRFRLRGGSNTIQGSLDAKVLLDGNEVSYTTLNAIPVSQIAFIDVLKGLSSTTIFGGGNGIVAVYTKRAGFGSVDDYYDKPDYVANIKYEGYSSNREFYSPDYSVVFAGAEKPDMRTTLYWNPRVSINEGKGKVEFYSSDVASNYIIEVQGLTANGIPFTGYNSFEVRQ
ncbi:MAG: TonB-dependent receptor plug domain-containing protein [Saprospiraceae bacterium]|nr:TonB-dependent receptor plug domain-containing protein [Saprospiraceae bacterium]